MSAFSHLIIATLTAAVLLFGCAKEQSDLVIVSSILKNEKSTSTAVPDEFSSFAPASLGNNYYVEGTVKNDGTSDAVDVILTFKAHDGSQTRTLSAEISELKAGQTVGFRTRLFRSKYTLKLLEEDTDISYESK